MNNLSEIKQLKFKRELWQDVCGAPGLTEPASSATSPSSASITPTKPLASKSRTSTFLVATSFPVPPKSKCTYGSPDSYPTFNLHLTKIQADMHHPLPQERRNNQDLDSGAGAFCLESNES
ncbi:hypothetical protein V5O48_006894 [Marasmius crinis-equi]|uniref:Uncharacterized protein n=1 Tax=Marasmius crinis-equi TaxID=585013 RepID=A0ABR3FIA1_9AGAR